MDILGKMQDAAPKCFDNLFEAQKFIEECSCIYRICMQARAYNLLNDIGIRHKWTDDRKCLNDLAHIFSDKVVDPTWMVALAEEMYRSVQDGEKKHYMLTLVLRAPRSIGKLSIDNIVDFAKNLYIAEGFRQLLLEGKEESLDVPTLATFDWKLRNACFDVYIDLRKEQIKEELEQDNTRVDGASDVECLEYLFDEESSAVNRENGLEQFRGSAAYNAMWYPGRQIVLDMINVFIKYLQKRIEKAKKDEAENEALAAISSNAAVEKVIAGIKHAMSGQVAQPQTEPKQMPDVEQHEEPLTNKTSTPDDSFFATNNMDYETCKKELLRCIRESRTKAAACRAILTSAHVYFILSDKTNQEIADAINPWVPQSGKDYVFTEDDFRKARKSKK